MTNIIIRIICVCAVIACASALIFHSYSEYKADKTAAEARLRYEQAMAQKKPAYHAPAARTPSPAPTQPPALGTAQSPAPSPTPSPSPTFTPSSTPRAIQAEFEALRETYGNDDIVGYLKIPGTGIDYPVTHAGDNTYYLKNDIYKHPSAAGWIFMDYENNIEKDDRNIVIYGHNMHKRVMFHDLRYYQSWDYFNKHRYVMFSTAYESYVWEIFSFYKANVSFPYIQVVFPSDGAFHALAAEMKKRSAYDTGVDILPGDHILTLSTCTNEGGDTRFVLNARRLSPGEAPADPL